MQSFQDWFAVQDPGVDGAAVVAERRRTGRRVGNGARPCEQVSGISDPLPEELFRRHVRRGTPELSGGGDPGVTSGENGNAEVDDARTMRSKEDVGGFQVAVRDALPVDVLQRGGDADRNLL